VAPLVFRFLQFLLNPAGPACVFYFFFPFACKDFCALLSKIKWTCFFLFLLSFWEEPASSHVFFWSSLHSVSCCFGAVNYGKSHKKRNLKICSSKGATRLVLVLHQMLHACLNFFSHCRSCTFTWWRELHVWSNIFGAAHAFIDLLPIFLKKLST
jgi:hypothetical protein